MRGVCMSASVVSPLQERILTLLEQQGPIGAKEIGLWLKGVDRIGLDTQLQALRRNGQIILSGSIYSRGKESAGSVPAEAGLAGVAA